MDYEKCEKTENCAANGGEAEVSEDNKCCQIGGEKISTLENEINILKDALLRKAAELENLRKRMEREKDEAAKYSNSKFAKDLLCVLDNFQKIVENFPTISDKVEHDPMLKAFFDGVVLNGRELTAVFSRYGLSRIETSPGDAFDPSRHHAMCHVESKEFPVGAVVQILQDGYLHYDRLLRPAMVAVAQSSSDDETAMR
ncbi:MAG: nucleotide exchange factor GrpE [Holosporaceae bacterium]|jgi:molecular chaperone GrpE|nr:nucleotide exchange factor GrpE [Holosporaceae bacterium]